jgi:hypothetical protein
MPRLFPVRIDTIAWCLLVAQTSVSLIAAETRPTSAAAAQVWLINTHAATGCGDLEAGLSKITYCRLEESGACGHWQPSDGAAFRASAAPGVPTIVLIHGNNTDEDWAVRHGDAFYCQLKRQACGRPFRLVVWSWPAGRAARRPRADVQIKACRSDVEAYFLARILSDLPKSVPMSLVGFSLGCQTASGALELLAGGQVACRSLFPRVVADWNCAGPRPIRVMMVAAAMDYNLLEPCCPHGLASASVERILVVRNGCDRVLKWYSHLYGGHGPEALGYVGSPSTLAGKLDVVDVSCEVGHIHDFDRYFLALSVDQRLAWYAFLCDPVAVAGKVAGKSAVASQ